MDKIDQKLLLALDNNPRMPQTRLAKQLRISQQVVSYRMQGLEKGKSIQKLAAIINLKKLGYEQYRIFFNFKANKYPNEEIFAFLKSQPGVFWAARLGGAFDLHVTLFVFDFDAFDAFMDLLNRKFPDLIEQYTAGYAIEHHLFKHKYLGSDAAAIKTKCTDPVVQLTKIDRIILREVSENCRVSALEMGKKAKVSYKTIISHQRNLEKSGVIAGYRLFVRDDTHKPFIVLLGFGRYATDQEKRLLAFLEQHHNVTQTVRLFGKWHLFCHIRADSSESVQKLLISLRSRFSIIHDYEVIPVFEDVAINLLPV